MADHPMVLAGISLAECQRIFEMEYCQRPITAFDGLVVRFRKDQFYHCFYESVSAKDDFFSAARAERVYWIKWALSRPDAELFFGWDSKRKRVDLRRRVAIVNSDYVVIVRYVGVMSAEFVTAFPADNFTLAKIRLGQRWEKKNR